MSQFSCYKLRAQTKKYITIFSFPWFTRPENIVDNSSYFLKWFPSLCRQAIVISSLFLLSNLKLTLPSDPFPIIYKVTVWQFTASITFYSSCLHLKKIKESTHLMIILIPSHQLTSYYLIILGPSHKLDSSVRRCTLASLYSKFHLSRMGK